VYYRKRKFAIPFFTRLIYKIQTFKQNVILEKGGMDKGLNYKFIYLISQEIEDILENGKKS